MSIPTTTAIRTRLQQRGVHTKHLDSWASFLTGLDWRIITPLVQMATGAGVHPALAAGMTARKTGDENIRTLLVAHLETKAGELNEGTGQPGTPPRPHRVGIGGPPA